MPRRLNQVLSELMYFCEIEKALSKLQALSYLEHHLKWRLEVEDSELPENQLTWIEMRDLYIGLEYTQKCVKRVQMKYMRLSTGLYMALSTSNFYKDWVISTVTCIFQKNFLNSWISMKSLKYWVKPRLLSGMKQWVKVNIDIYKILVRNLFLTSIVYRTWRKSGAPTIRLGYTTSKKRILSLLPVV
jgi:hypothetical protein